MQNWHHTGKPIQPSSAVRSVGQSASIRCLHQNEREDAVMELNERHDMTKTLYWKPKGELLFSLAFGQTLKQSKNRCIVTWPSLPMGLRFKCSSLTCIQSDTETIKEILHAGQSNSRFWHRQMSKTSETTNLCWLFSENTLKSCINAQHKSPSLLTSFICQLSSLLEAIECNVMPGGG